MAHPPVVAFPLLDRAEHATSWRRTQQQNGQDQQRHSLHGAGSIALKDFARKCARELAIRKQPGKNCRKLSGGKLAACWFFGLARWWLF
jgi:hypothetical protein